MWPNSFYKKLMRKKILQKNVVTIGGQQILLYIMDDCVYPILTQIENLSLQQCHEVLIEMHMTRI